MGISCACACLVVSNEKLIFKILKKTDDDDDNGESYKSILDGSFVCLLLMIILLRAMNSLISVKSYRAPIFHYLSIYTCRNWRKN